MSSDVIVSSHELSIEVKYLYIARKGFLMIRNSRLFVTHYRGPVRGVPIIPYT